MNQYVDWIAADGYDRVDSNLGVPEGYVSVFDDFYREYTDPKYQQIPLMIGETGACQQYDTFFPPQYGQAQYIKNLTTAIEGNAITPMTNYPAFKSLNYYDADTGSYSVNGQHCLWNFTPGSAGGLGAFGSAVNTQYFEHSIPGT